jgi:hypothetical protein
VVGEYDEGWIQLPLKASYQPEVGEFIDVVLGWDATADSFSESNSGLMEEIREENGGYTAVDDETGVSATASSRAGALLELSSLLLSESDVDYRSIYESLSEEVQQRFEEEEVDEDTVEEAIEWANPP